MEYSISNSKDLNAYKFSILKWSWNIIRNNYKDCQLQVYDCISCEYNE